MLILLELDIGLPLIIAARALIAFAIKESIFTSAFWTFYIHNLNYFRLIKKCAPQVHLYNNRHRQAPSTHTNKQAVRTKMIANNFDYPRVHIESHAPEQNWRFCCLRTFQF